MRSAPIVVALRRDCASYSADRSTRFAMTLGISGSLLSAVGLVTAIAIGLIGPAEAKTKKHPRPAAVATPYGGPVSGGWRYGPPSGALYNGQDYPGTDPDPNIRFQILRDLSLRYGGGAD
jgi:hypothetical protein